MAPQLFAATAFTDETDGLRQTTIVLRSRVDRMMPDGSGRPFRSMVFLNEVNCSARTWRILGTRYYGADYGLISETGADMSRFASVAHFPSWLGLCPGTKITGGKTMSGKTKRVANRAAQALRLAAAGLRTSQSALGAYYRRMCSRMDKPKAVTAAAHKLARLIYTMLTRGEEYTDQGQAYYEERYRQRVLHNLAQRANKMGMKLVAAEQPA
jgi:hypothetical protein